MQQGIDAARMRAPGYLLLTDADIVYAPDTLTRLVARAEKDGLVLNSLMAKLRRDSIAERGLIPAFVFFFQMLYPFAWANRPGSATAAAAGGCMLARAAALEAAGGIASIRGALIDDCALARRLKQQGPIRLALTERVLSIRDYPALGDIRRMVARSAYAQLRFSPLLLAGTVAGMALTYLAPVLLAVFGNGLARAFGIAAWALMALAFQPTLRLYRATPLWGLALPAIALVYMVFTLDSAYQHARGAGGLWKGRVQAGLQ
jgi:hopene-associated glycosyltransferase HpnB